VLPVQLGEEQSVFRGYFAQAPRPSHTPVVPQVDLSCAAHLASGSPFPRGWHMPTKPVWLQETHSVSQATLQHTPSAQNPDAQSVPLVQGPVPLGSFPQLLLMQLWPGLQSLSLVHRVRH
jgi:hypothetical protein